MAVGRIQMVLTLVLVAALWEGRVVGQSSCSNVIITLSPCLNYITGKNSSAPSSSCCSQLGNVATSQPQCLCQLLSGGGSSSSFGVNINQTLALALPSACHVQTPSINRCNATDGGSSDGNSTKTAFPLLFFLLFIASYALSSTAN